MSNGGNIDYDALAKQYGATSSQPSTIDYDALAKQHGAISSTTYHGVVPQATLDNLRAKSAEPTQFEKDRAPAVEESQTVRNPWAEAGNFIKNAIPAALDEAGNIVKNAPGMVKALADPIHTGLHQAADIAVQDQLRKNRGAGGIERAGAAVGSAAGANMPAVEHAADIGNAPGVVGTLAADVGVPVAVGELVKAAPKFGPAVEKFAGSAVDKFNIARDAGVKEAMFPNPAGKMPEAANLPPKAVSGVEDIYRAAAPTGKNAGFRENVMAAAPDLADVARKVDIAEKKGGIVNPDMRVRATVDALDSHLNDMYQKERVPQIQAHADVPVKVGTSPDSIRALEYLETTAGTEDVRALASKALGVEGTSGVRFAAKPLTLAEADTLAQAANKYLKSYERAPSDVQMQMQQTSPKVGGLKSLDTELGRSIDKVLTSNGEIGIRDYERRYAAVSEVRNQLRDRMNAVELERQSLGKYVKVVTGGKEAIASASQAAVSSVNIGRRLQTAFQKLRESGITAKK